MRKWVHTGVIAAALVLGLAAFLGSSAASAQSLPPGKPLLSDMKNENDPTVQQVRDALIAFKGTKKRWPTDLSTLRRFAEESGLPLDLAAFSKTNYRVEDSGDAKVAVFEFSMKGTAANGAFALVDYVVK